MTASHLRAGQLNRYVNVQQRSASRDAIGQPVVSWTDVRSVYAYIEALSAAKRATSGAVFTDVTHQLTVRYDAIFSDPRTATTYRIVYGARTFEVMGIENVDETNAIVILNAREGLNNG